MKLEFRTERDINGNRKYLAIDTERKQYATLCPKMITEGYILKKSDYFSLIKALNSDGYTYSEYLGN